MSFGTISAAERTLAERGTIETHVSASDENSMDDAVSIMSGYDATTLGYMAQMNVHSYAGSGHGALQATARPSVHTVGAEHSLNAHPAPASPLGHSSTQLAAASHSTLQLSSMHWNLHVLPGPQ